MGRPLKFRIWDNEQEKYLDGITNLYEALFNDGCYYGYASGLDENVKRYVIEQFTGITNSKGVDLYEGDITKEGTIIWDDELGWDGGGSSHPSDVDVWSGYTHSGANNNTASAINPPNVAGNKKRNANACDGDICQGS